MFQFPFLSSRMVVSIFIGLSVLLASESVLASRVVNVSQATVAVSDQSQATQKQAARDALREVMIKLSGQQNIAKERAISSAIRNATQYLRSYRFEYQRNTLFYVAEFDFEALSRLLKDNQLPLWGQHRPDTLLWLGIEEENGNRFVLDESTADPLADTLRQLSTSRAVPLILPIMDFDDATQISIYDIWGRFTQNIESASERYKPDYIIGARLYQNQDTEVPTFVDQSHSDDAANDDENNRRLSFGEAFPELSQYLVEDLMPETVEPAFTEAEFEQMKNRASEGEYALDWVIITTKKTEYGSLYGDTPESLLSAFYNQYADLLGKHFAISPGQQAQKVIEITISVANLDTLPKYVRAQAYLNSISMVDDVTLVQQTGSVASFTLKLLANEQDFINLLSLDSRLQQVKDAFGQPLEGFNFYWNQ